MYEDLSKSGATNLAECGSVRLSAAGEISASRPAYSSFTWIAWTLTMAVPLP